MCGLPKSGSHLKIQQGLHLVLRTGKPRVRAANLHCGMLFKDFLEAEPEFQEMK